jgi:cell shape-determining protein MreC
VLLAILGILLAYTVPQFVRFSVALFWLPYDAVRLWVLESQDSLPTYLRERHTLDARIRELEGALAIARGSEQTVTKLEYENQELRTLLGAVPEARILARVIARPNQLPYDVVMIDRGERNGVLLHAPVYTGRDQIIGFVTKVFDRTSHVTLVTTPGFEATAYVYGPNIYTTTEGMGSGVLRVRVPQGIALNETDLVIFPAIDSGVFGSIIRVETSPTKPERYGYVLADTALQSLQYVSVGRESVQTHSFAEAQAVVAETAARLFSIDVPVASLVTPETFPSGTSSDEVIATSSDTAGEE